MATYEIPCECGVALPISATQAGTSATCSCGRNIPVPSLGDLRRQFQVDEKSDLVKTANHRWGITACILVGLVSLFSVWYLKLKALGIILFALLFIGGKLWFLATMLSEMGTIAIFVFLIPFFDWLFLFKRFDVAWKPVCLQLIGLAFLFVIAN